MDMEFGPDGALYTLEYGDGFFSENPEAELSRVDFVRGGEYTPIVRVSATPTSALAPPLTVRFSSAGTVDPDGDRIAYAWDFDANGTIDSRVANPTYTYTQRGIYEATLRVTDTSGRSASNSVRITIGNQAPRVTMTVVSTSPPFNFGDTVTFNVTVTDDQPVDCARVTRRVHPRPRPARAPAVVHRGLLGHDRGAARHRRTPARPTSRPSSSPPTPTSPAAARRRSRAASRSSCGHRLRPRNDQVRRRAPRRFAAPDRSCRFRRLPFVVECMNKLWEVTWEGELPASPQAVWDTFTRHADSYLWPIEYEPRVGGAERGLTQGGGTVTVWEPHRHFATRTRPEHERDGLNEIDTSSSRWARSPTCATRTGPRSPRPSTTCSSRCAARTRPSTSTRSGQAACYLPRPTGRVRERRRGRAASFAEVVRAARRARGRRRRRPRCEGGVIDYLTPSFLGVRGADALFRVYGRDTWGYPVGTTTHRFPTRTEA